MEKELIFTEACIMSEIQTAELALNKYGEEDDYEFSPKFKKKMSKLSGKMRNNKYHRMTKTATSLLIAAIIITFSAMTIAGFAIHSYVVTKHNNHSSYHMTDGTADKIKDGLTVEYLPEGYVETDRTEGVYSIFYEFTNNNNVIHVSKDTSNTTVNFNTETEESKEITINGITYVIYTSDNKNNGIIWNNNGFVYSIDGNVSEDELIKIAESTF